MGWRPAKTPADERQPAEFAFLVASQLPPNFGREALRATQAVFRPPGIRIRVTDLSEETMPINATTFGTITINGKTYDHDVIIRLSGVVEKRRKRLSKEMYGTSHVVSKAEAKFVFEDDCELLIVGAGQDGNVRLSPEASEYFDKKHCRVVLQRTPEAVLTYNKSPKKKKAALMHVTC